MSCLRVLKWGCLSFIGLILLVFVVSKSIYYFTTDFGRSLNKTEVLLISNPDIKIIDIQDFKNIQIIQLSRYCDNALPIIGLHHAFANDLIKVSEVSESGSVNEIIIEHWSDKSLFILDGDIIYGAKQNRVFNTSILLPPNYISNLSVSCIEHGRWANESYDFESVDYLVHSDIRKRKINNRYNDVSVNSNQTMVWEEVSRINRKSKSRSDTNSHTVIYESQKETIDSLVQHFNIDSTANGLACFINGELISVEMFYSVELYQDYFLSLISTVSIESTFENENSDSLMNNVDITNVINNTFSAYTDNLSQFLVFKGQVLGDDAVLVTDDYVFNSLIYNKQIIHQSIFSK